MIKKAMIMAAGVGSRLDPLTRDVPKPLVPIANKPLMDIILKKLEKSGIDNVVSNTFCLAEQIENRYSQNNPTSAKLHCIKEECLSGTAGGVKKCEFFFDGEKTFLVLSGDGLTDVDLNKIYESHVKSNAIVTIGLTYVPKEKTCNFGVIVVDDDGFISEFQEKPCVEEARSNLINTGIYVFDVEIFKFIPEDTFYDFAKNVFVELMEKKIPINTYICEGYWSDIGTIEQYRQSSFDILDGKVNIDVDGIENGILIGDNTSVHETAKLVSHNIIGNNCTIGQNVCLEDCIIWDNVVIENNVKLKNVIVTNGIIRENIAAEDIVLSCSSGDKEYCKS